VGGIGRKPMGVGFVLVKGVFIREEALVHDLMPLLEGMVLV